MPFISRRAELARLHDALASAAAGRPRTVVIAGDAGVGKTRLLRAALDRVEGRVLSGGCVDVTADSLPFAPFVEALRGFADELDPHDAGGALSATAQGRLFERLLGLLGRLGEDEGPVVLAIEDLHWADRSTRDLVRFLVTNARSERLAIVATYRADDLHRGHPLRALVAELERSGRAERLHLLPFSRGEVNDQIAAIIGTPPNPDFLADVFARSEGNAFFVEQLVATAREDGGRRLPTLLHDILVARFERLAPEAQRLLGVLAAGGPRVGEPLLAAACGYGDDEREASLRAAVHHQLLELDGDAYMFHHALLREAAYGELLPGERRRLHAAYGAALTAAPELARDPGGVDAELARHWHAAGEHDAALAASIAAAAAAERRHGFNEADTHYARALELWDAVADPAAAAGVDRVRLLRRAAEVANLAGASTRAAVLIRSALAAAGGRRCPLLVGELHERLGRYLWASGDSEAATSAYEEAVRLVPATPPSRPRARVLAARGQALMLLSRFEESRASCEEAIRIARLVGARAVEGHALNTLGVDLACLGRPAVAVEHLAAARVIAEEVGDLDDLARAYLNLADVLVSPLDRLEEAVQVARDGIKVCDRVGLGGDYGVSLRAVAAGALVELGRWEEAGELLREASERTPIEMAAIDFHLAHAKLSVGRGALEETERHLEAVGELMTNTVDPQYTGPLAARRAELALRQRRPQDALAIVDDGLERADDSWYAAPLLWLGVRAAANVVGDARTLESARRTGRRLLAARRRDAAPPVVTAYATTAVAEGTRLRRAADPNAWERAVAEWDVLRRPHAAAYCRFRQAEALLEQRRRREAGEVLALAAETARELCALPLADEIELLAQRGRLALAGDEEPAAPEPGPAGLTARELEVLALVARGMTNRDVGKALFVTEKTASAHVSSILAKLSVRSRVEAAAAAHQMGLV